ncbi:MAG: hypothetical protein JNK94_04340 [Hyphomonadaceae bacterium]|nr:hypothetical protein [Hyphomonadaceae bacterium]MBX3511688.1 hypothetical protein [Hyphomonadaceae bacterium]
MRSLLLCGALATLAACATAAPSAPTPTAAAAAPAAPSRLAQMLAAAGRANAPVQQEVERSLGRPDVVRRDGAGAALTYRMETCALLLLFAADARNEMRLAEAHPSARRAGEAAPSLDQCAAEAATRGG